MRRKETRESGRPDAEARRDNASTRVTGMRGGDEGEGGEADGVREERNAMGRTESGEQSESSRRSGSEERRSCAGIVIGGRAGSGERREIMGRESWGTVAIGEVERSGRGTNGAEGGDGRRCTEEVQRRMESDTEARGARGDGQRMGRQRSEMEVRVRNTKEAAVEGGRDAEQDGRGGQGAGSGMGLGEDSVTWGRGREGQKGVGVELDTEINGERAMEGNIRLRLHSTTSSC
ncbi:hypothetical protein C8R44DRAFT_741013 [Mycena epipterygia]|nr:hypothetical protein C8R44DRAFT_741013 [Mycena epipterygia]